MDLQRAIMMATDCMKYHGLPERGWRFELDNAKRRLGVCRTRSRIISISKPSLLLNSEDEVLDTILHEIAHALAPSGAHHGWQWKMMARSIGAKPERCGGSDVIQVPTDWTGQCADCFKTINRVRRPTDRMMRTGFHTRCKHKANGGKLTWRHKGYAVQVSEGSKRSYYPGTIDSTRPSV